MESSAPWALASTVVRLPKADRSSSDSYVQDEYSPVFRATEDPKRSWRLVFTRWTNMVKMQDKYRRHSDRLTCRLIGLVMVGGGSENLRVRLVLSSGDRVPFAPPYLARTLSFEAQGPHYLPGLVQWPAEAQSVRVELGYALPEGLASALASSRLGLTGLLNRATSSDFEIRAGDISVPCHKIVLAAASPIFKAMLTSEMEESVQGRLTIEDYDGETIRGLVEFLYTGDASAIRADPLTFLRLYHKYDVCDLKEPAMVLAERSLSPDTVLEAAAVASLLDLPDLSRRSKLLFQLLLGQGHAFSTSQWRRLKKDRPAAAAKLLDTLPTLIEASPAMAAGPRDSVRIEKLAVDGTTEDERIAERAFFALDVKRGRGALPLQCDKCLQIENVPHSCYRRSRVDSPSDLVTQKLSMLEARLHPISNCIKWLSEEVTVEAMIRSRGSDEAILARSSFSAKSLGVNMMDWSSKPVLSFEEGFGLEVDVELSWNKPDEPAAKEEESFSPATLRTGIISLLSSGEFSDGEVKLDNGSVLPVLKAVLASASPVFEELIQQAKEGEAVVVAGVSEATMRGLIAIVCAGDETAFLQSPEEILKAAQRFRLTSVTELCAAAMLRTLSFENLCRYALLADRYQTGGGVAEACRAIVQEGLRWGRAEVREVEWAFLVETQPTAAVALLDNVLTFDDE